MRKTIEFEHQLFTLDETAEHLRISRAYVFRLLSENRLRAIKAGRRTLLTGRELLRFVAECEAK